MNVVLIADDGPANAWLIAEVERAHAIQLIIRPDWSALRPALHPAGRARAAASPVARVTRALRRGYFEPRDRAATARLAQALFESGRLPRPRAMVETVPAWDINGPATEAMLRHAAPDLVVVSGAPILRSNIYGLPRLGTVNLHFGISPAYRGMHTLLLPWQRRDYEHLGATLHCIDEGIDSGPVLFRVYPELTPADDLVAVEARIVRLAAGELSGFLTTLGAGSWSVPLLGRTMGSSGVLVRFHDRTIRADLGDRVRRIAGQRVPSRAARVERFYAR